MQMRYSMFYVRIPSSLDIYSEICLLAQGMGDHKARRLAYALLVILKIEKKRVTQHLWAKINAAHVIVKENNSSDIAARAPVIKENKKAQKTEPWCTSDNLQAPISLVPK